MDAEEMLTMSRPINVHCRTTTTLAKTWRWPIIIAQVGRNGQFLAEWWHSSGPFGVLSCVGGWWWRIVIQFTSLGPSCDDNAMTLFQRKCGTRLLMSLTEMWLHTSLSSGQGMMQLLFNGQWGGMDQIDPLSRVQWRFNVEDDLGEIGSVSH